MQSSAADFFFGLHIPVLGSEDTGLDRDMWNSVVSFALNSSDSISELQCFEEWTAGVHKGGGSREDGEEGKGQTSASGMHAIGT